MNTVKLEWSKRPRVAWDHTFGEKRYTWRTREDGYQISRCTMPDFTLIYPAWARKRPTYHRTLKGAMAAAEAHRNNPGE